MSAAKLHLLHWAWGDPEHNRQVLGDVASLLRFYGLPAPQEHGPAEESAADERLRRLTALQRYSPHWQTYHLERLPPDQLDVAELQIREAAYHAGMDVACRFERLAKAGHDAKYIAEVMGLDIAMVGRWLGPRANEDESHPGQPRSIGETWDLLMRLRKSGLTGAEMAAASGISAWALRRAGWIDERGPDDHLH